jgi:drug/metabolite transporter (DMT)-like permease
MAYISIIIAQALYTISDTWKKVIFNAGGFKIATLLRPAFILALLLAGVGFAFQLYALSKLELSRTIVILGMLAVIFSSAAGVFYLKEHLNVWNVLGVVLAVLAIFLVNFK